MIAKLFVPKRHTPTGTFQIKVILALIFLFRDSIFSLEITDTTYLSTEENFHWGILYKWLPSFIYFPLGCQCNDIFNPVCGMNGLTYPSVCEGRYESFQQLFILILMHVSAIIYLLLCNLTEKAIKIELFTRPTKLVV